METVTVTCRFKKLICENVSNDVDVNKNYENFKEINIKNDDDTNNNEFNTYMTSIVDISIRKLAIDRRTHCHYGYGFIFYHDCPQGLAAALYTLQAKSNIKAYSNNENFSIYPISYSLQSSKGLSLPKLK